MDGVYKETLTGFGLPANVDTWQNLMLVAELKSCVTLLDENNKVVAPLGPPWNDWMKLKTCVASQTNGGMVNSFIPMTPALLQTATFMLPNGLPPGGSRNWNVSEEERCTCGELVSSLNARVPQCALSRRLHPFP